MRKTQKSTNQNILIGVIVLIVVVVASVIFVIRSSRIYTSNLITASYTNGSTTIEAAFDNSKETVTFTEPSLGKVTLPHAMSASGSRYANSDESIVFWEHQGEVTINHNGETIFQGRSGQSPSESGQDITSNTWVWEYTTMNDGSIVTPTKADAFTMTFGSDGRVSITTDCNNGNGTYTITKPAELSFGAIASTKKFCIESQEGMFYKNVEKVVSFHFENGKLVLMLSDGEKMIFGGN